MPKRGDLRATGTPPNGLVASATNLKQIPSGVRPGGANSQWQDRLWTFYDIVGEFEYVVNWIGDLASKAELYAAEDGKRLTSGPAFDAVEELFGSKPGKADALRMLAIMYTVPGEAYVFTYEEDSEQKWVVAPGQVVTGSSGTNDWKIDGKDVPSKNRMVIRTWERHPRRMMEVTSSSRAAIPILNEIVRLTQHIEAQISSRLSSAGILLMPNEITFGSASETEGEEKENQSASDAFVQELMKVAGTAINDRGDASALVPIVVTADGEHLDKPRLLQFWTELDSHALELRQAAIRRLALALNIPPEILTGSGDVSHWQAWGIEDSSIKIHADPLLARICSDLSAGYLWPSLKGQVDDDRIKHFTIQADTSGMRVRPNRSQEAIELYDRGLLKAEAVRRETGFDPTDKPNASEDKLWLTKQLAKGSTTPEMVDGALRILGVELPVTPEGDGDGTTETPQPPSLEDHPKRKAVPSIKEQDELDDDAKRKAEAAALVAAAEQMVFRALDKGGNRIANRVKFKLENVEPAEVYLFRKTTDAEASFMLEGAFEHVKRFSKRYGVNPQALAATLDEYCRSLIVEQKPYNVDELARRLKVMEVTHVG